MNDPSPFFTRIVLVKDLRFLVLRPIYLHDPVVHREVRGNIVDVGGEIVQVVVIVGSEVGMMYLFKRCIVEGEGRGRWSGNNNEIVNIWIS